MSFDAEIKLQVVMILIEAAAFLALAGWCFARWSARWSRPAAAGAGLLGGAKAVFALAAFEQVFLSSRHIDETLLVHRHTYTVLNTAIALGAVLLVAAFVESRRRSL